MEHSGIISSIITAVATLIVGGGAFFVGSYNSKFDKTSTILEEQYLKVISPIHYILRTVKREKLYSEISDVIGDNYHLLPDGLYDDFMNFANEEISKQEFEKKIDEFNRILRFKLGYSKIKITKQDKETEKQLADSKSFSFIKYIVYALSFLIGLFLPLVFGYAKTNSGELKNLSVSIFLVLIVTFVLLIVACVDYYKRK